VGEHVAHLQPGLSLFLTWALALGNHLFQALDSLTAPEFAGPVLFGASWIAQVLFRILIQRVGLALAWAIAVGSRTLLGTLVSLLVQHRALVDKALLIEILIGIAVALIGIRLSEGAGNFEPRPR